VSEGFGVCVLLFSNIIIILTQLSTLCLCLSFSSSSHGFHQFSYHCLVWYFSFTLFIFFIFSLIHSHFKNPPVFICRGSGEDGQLGIGTNEDKEWVCTVKALPSQRVRSVVAGSRNSLAICHDGKVINISQLVVCHTVCLGYGNNL
jgi:hypothetical protein